MAIKKSLVERLYKISRFSNQTVTNCRISTSAVSVPTRIPYNPTNNPTSIAPDPGDNGIFRRLFHKMAGFHPSDLRQVQMGGAAGLMEKLPELNIWRDRITLEGLTRPSPPVAVAVKEEKGEMKEEEGLTMEDARKLLRVAQMESVKSKLREMKKAWIPRSEFVRMCGEGCGDPDQGIRIARALDESGTVIVLGNLVCLQPEQVLKAIGGLIPLPAAHPSDPRRKELEGMEKRKAAIDKKAQALVRRELWCGLGFLVVQTAGFMRLTFWELSWDVMEPICFYVTSVYFMAGYAFFLRTSKEPSFEGFYQSRFSAKQRQLMKLHNFNVERYEELRRACYPYPSSTTVTGELSAATASFDQAGNA